MEVYTCFELLTLPTSVTVKLLKGKKLMRKWLQNWGF